MADPNNSFPGPTVQGGEEKALETTLAQG